MFWKKKSDDVLIEYDSSERRQDVRLKPTSLAQIIYGSGTTEILDVSVHGLSFKAADIPVNSKLEVTLKLYDVSKPLILQLEVLKKTVEVCHCRVVDISDKSLHELERYILAEQKRQIKARQRATKEQRNT